MSSKPLPPLDHIPASIAAVEDYAVYARDRMTPSAWAYMEGAAADGVTSEENLAAFQRLRLQQRVLTDMAGATTQLTLLGQQFEYPIFLAPVAYQKLAHTAGEIGTVQAASAMGAGMIVSAQASVRLEEIAATARTPLWFQLYIQPDRDFTLQLVRRAEAAGYRALVLTVDAPVNGVRNQEQRAGFALPSDIHAVNLRGCIAPAHVAQPGTSPIFGSTLLTGAPTWQDVQWLVQQTRLPVLLKGITHPEDAVLGLDYGAAGIIVSNHGGRTLDTLPATIDMLPGIARAVNGRSPVLLDGGIRRGSDIFKALALGANAVLVGRPYIYALAAAGAAGVAHVLHILRTELEVTMALAGTPTLTDIGHHSLSTPT